MIITKLNGTYKLKYYEHDTFEINGILGESFYPEDWMDTFVPEDVRTALKRCGYLDGYYYGKNLDQERWIEEKDWVYCRSFYVGTELWEKENILCLEGIDTIARVWINDVYLGMCHNMFLEYEFDVTKALHYGKENRLIIQVLSPLGYTVGMSREDIYPKEDTTRMLLRKSQMNWGWDFCGHCLTTGIWKEIFMKSRDCAFIEYTELVTEELTEKAARLHLKCEIKDAGTMQEEYGILLELCRDGTTVISKTLSVAKAADHTFLLEQPSLWWPRPYGEAALYDVRICLVIHGSVLDEKKFRFGIRTVELIQEQDAGGRSFLFCVNGKRLFIRGANWVPLNSVYAEIKEEEYDSYIDRAVDSNITMLRIWGGGIYESGHFLDLCDEKGIMIFQDMMLACGIFPQNKEFLDEVYKEAKLIVRKLINRACIVTWSADNELDEAYRWYNLLDEFGENKVNRIAVRKGVEEHDTSRPFLVSSPCSPFEAEEGGDDPNSDRQGDMHLYLTRFLKGDVYYYKKILELKPRFMSEYGFSSLPWESSYYRFNFFREPLDLTRNPWLAQLDWLGEIGEKGDTSKIIYLSQFTHAQGLKYWIEYLRSLKWHCGGSLYWKFNDPTAPNRENMLFPSLMSCIDFFGLPKLAYYYARRAYEDIILAFREETDGRIKVIGCNETEEAPEGILTVSLKTYDGEVLWSEKKECRIAKDLASELYCIPAERLDGPKRHSSYIYAEFISGEIKYSNLFYLTEIGEWNQVQMDWAALKAGLCVREDVLEITISCDSFVQDVTIDILDEDVYYSDNSFCMQKGECRTIQARGIKSLRKTDWKKAYATDDISAHCSAQTGIKLRIRAGNADDLYLTYRWS